MSKKGYTYHIIDKIDYDKDLLTPLAILFSEKLGGIVPYTVLNAEQSYLDKVVSEITYFYNTIKKDISCVKHIFGNSKYTAFTQAVLKIAKEEKLNNEDMLLSCIGLYEFNYRPTYKSKEASESRMIRGGIINLENIFDKNLDPVCIDAACFIKSIACQFGIFGKIKKVVCDVEEKEPIHRYFVSENRTVVDTFARPYLDEGYMKESIFLDKLHKFLKRKKSLKNSLVRKK